MMNEIVFSVVIPTRNRPQQLAACLQSFCNLDYPRGMWEIIVVNDGGTKSLTAVSPDLLRTLPLRIVEAPHRGPAAARNTGVRTAVNSYLAFTDDDCRVTPDWLRQLAAGFEATGADGLGGYAVNPIPQNEGMAASTWLVEFLYQHFRDAGGDALVLVSNNVAYRRQAFEAVGGFDEQFPLAAAEDMDLSRRMRDAGWRQRYWPAARVIHDHQLSRWGHVQQQFRYGRGGRIFLEKRRASHARIADDGRRGFYPALWRALCRSDLSLYARLLVLAGQVAYHAGQTTERMGW